MVAEPNKQVKKKVENSVSLYYNIDTVKTELLAILSVEFASPVPIYEQIKRRLKQALAQGALRPGEELPSIR